MATAQNEPDASYFTLKLPNDADAPAMARSYLNDHAGWLAPDLLDDALILVSEIVTNAIHYGRPEITLCLRNHPPSVGVEVHDNGTALPSPAPVPPPASEPNGRGLLIVNALANHWGVVPSAPSPGKTVWFEIGPSDALAEEH